MSHEPEESSTVPDSNSSSSAFSDPEETTSSEAIDERKFRINVFRKSESLEILEGPGMTVAEAKFMFAEKLNEVYGMQEDSVIKAIDKVTAFVPAKEVALDSTVVPAANDDETMEQLFTTNASGLLLIETNEKYPNFYETSMRFRGGFRRKKAEARRLASQLDHERMEQHSAIEELNDQLEKQHTLFLQKLEDEAKRRDSLLKEQRELFLEELGNEVKKRDEEVKKRDEEVKKRDEEMKKWMKKRDEEMKEWDSLLERLKVDLDKERERAQQAEKELADVTAAQAENITDTNEFIASGCREDTDAYYRIKIRHLINLVQARLAGRTNLSKEQNERDAAHKWHQYCSSLRSSVTEGDKATQAKGLIMQNLNINNLNDMQATIALLQSGALDLLVDDSKLRSAGDAAAHPGPLTKENVVGYRAAIKAHVDGNGEWGPVLNACVSFLFT